MNNDVSGDEISLRLLDQLEKNPSITQRSLSDRLGIALGLVNAYVRRLYNKGFIKITTIPKKRIKYIITPQGLTEKTRLTYQYMHYSIGYFKEVRIKIENAYSSMLKSDVETVLLWGDGELAELCYISTRGLPLKIVGVVSNTGIDRGFFGHRVYCSGEIAGVDYDAVLVSSMDEKMVADLIDSDIPRQKIYWLAEKPAIRDI